MMSVVVLLLESHCVDVRVVSLLAGAMSHVSRSIAYFGAH